MARVKLEGLSKRFGDTEVIRGVDLEIADGDFVVFVGPSGCGKSTLLRLIAGLEEATTGKVWIGDTDVTGLAPSKRGVSMVFQSYALYPHMDVYKNIAFGLSLAGTDKAGVDTRVRQAAERLQITPLLARRPRELSGGQRQRVAIARAIVREPQVFLFDEPLSNLDAALRAQTRLEFAAMHAELGATMIYVTHDQLEAMTLADRIVLLNQGRIEQVGAPTELYRAPATRFAAAFMGSPGMNFLAVQADEAGLALPGGARLSASGLSLRGPAELGVRPENLHLAETGLVGKVLLVEDLGEARIVHVALQDGERLAVRHPADQPPPAKGAAVRVALDTDHLHLFGPDGARVEPASWGSLTAG